MVIPNPTEKQIRKKGGKINRKIGERFEKWLIEKVGFRISHFSIGDAFFRSSTVGY